MYFLKENHFLLIKILIMWVWNLSKSLREKCIQCIRYHRLCDPLKYSVGAYTEKVWQAHTVWYRIFHRHRKTWGEVEIEPEAWQFWTPGNFLLTAWNFCCLVWGTKRSPLSHLLENSELSWCLHFQAVINWTHKQTQPCLS